MTKAWIQGKDLTILIMMNYATLLDDPGGAKSLAVSFKMMKHGAKYDMTYRNLDGDGVLYVDEEYITFWWDNEKLYYNTEKPTEKDIEELEIFELKSPTSNNIWET